MKDRDGLHSGTRIALMMRRFAEVAPAERKRARPRGGGWIPFDRSYLC